VPNVHGIAESVIVLQQMLEKLTTEVSDIKQALHDERETRQSLERALREEREQRQASDQPDEVSELPSEPATPTPPLHLPVGSPHSQEGEGNNLASSVPGPTTPPQVPRQLYSEAAAPKIRWFNGADDVLSNLHDCPLYSQGLWFSGSESIFQWRKAKMMRDFQSADRIVQAQHAYTSMKIGVAINPDKKWYDNMFRIMADCQLIKAQQYAPFREELIKSGTMSLRENTDHPIWGGRNKPQCNAFGSILELLRDDIAAGKVTAVQSNAYVKITDADAQPPPPNPAYSVSRAPPQLPRPPTAGAIPKPQQPAAVPPLMQPRQPPEHSHSRGPQMGRLPTPEEEEISGWQTQRHHRKRNPPSMEAYTAPKYSLPGGRGTGAGPCYVCGDYGHKKQRCPYNQHPYSSHSQGAGSCYRCGEHGHHERECSFYGPIRCSRCTGYGHKESKCPTAYNTQASYNSRTYSNY